MYKCESCIHRVGPDAEQCLQCREAAPSGANAALAVVLALLFTMTVVGVVEAARFGSSGEGLFAVLFADHHLPVRAQAGKKAPSVPQTPVVASVHP